MKKREKGGEEKKEGEKEWEEKEDEEEEGEEEEEEEEWKYDDVRKGTVTTRGSFLSPTSDSGIVKPNL